MKQCDEHTQYKEPTYMYVYGYQVDILPKDDGTYKLTCKDNKEFDMIVPCPECNQRQIIMNMVDFYKSARGLDE